MYQVKPPRHTLQHVVQGGGVVWFPQGVWGSAEGVLHCLLLGGKRMLWGEWEYNEPSGSVAMRHYQPSGVGIL